MHWFSLSTDRGRMLLVLGAMLLIAMAMFTIGLAPSTAVAMQAPTGTPAATVAATRAVTTTAATTSTITVPTIPAPVAVQLDPKTTALLILDVTNTICARPSCVATVPVDAALLKKARAAGVLVAYSDTSNTSTILPEVAAAAGNPRVTGRADKFFNTTLDDALKAKGIKTVVIVGYVANGAVLYTSFGANVRGYTVVVPVDGTGAEDPFITTMAFFQLLNQPGFNNPTNQPLVESRVTLSKSDLVTFVAGAPGPKPAATAQPATTGQPTAASTAAATKAATVAPTTAATAAPTAASASASPAAGAAAATDKKLCLGCHPAANLVKASYKTDAGETVNPHPNVPHDSTAEAITDCVNCHTAHPIPPTGKVDLSKVNLDWCYSSCHHQRNFTPCKQCH